MPQQAEEVDFTDFRGKTRKVDRGMLRRVAQMDRADKERFERKQKQKGKAIQSGKRGTTKADPSVKETKEKKLPLLPQERTNMYNTLNKMSQEQLRKYVSTFNKEARIVGGHAMKKSDLINAIIAKAKVVEDLLKKLRVDVPKMDVGPVDKVKGVPVDATGAKARLKEPKPVMPGQVGTRYEAAKVNGEERGVYYSGYAIKGDAAANRFESYSAARAACNKEGRCNAITREKVRGEYYYSMRNGTTAMKKEGGDEFSWKKKRQGKIDLGKPKK